MLPVQDPYFLDCLREAVHDPEFVAEFDRLTGHNLSRHGTGLDLMIDDASGRTEAGIREFCEFVRDHVYTPTKESVGAYPESDQ